MKFLLVEDDIALASAIEKLLADHHYVMDLATDGMMGKQMADVFSYDLILLDWTLPKLEGLQLCKQLRNEGNYTPIILMTARDASIDVVAGLDAGADDYIVKPFEFEELLARIRALLRRAEGLSSPILQWGELNLDPSSSLVTCRGTLVPLTPKEYALLELFLRNPARIFSLDNLLDKIWAGSDSPSFGSVRTHIKGLRGKLKDAGLSNIIDTVYGVGYRLKSPKSSTNFRAKQISTKPTMNQSANLQTQPSATLDMAPLWRPLEATYLQRVNNLAGTLRGLPSGLVEHNERQRLMREAHTLAGSLGTFGFSEVEQQCRAIEAILQANSYLSVRHIGQLNELMTQLQKTLETSTLTLSEKDSKAIDSNISSRAQESASSDLDLADIERTQEDLSPAPRLLIVDDDPEMLAFLEILLRPCDFQMKLLNNPHQFWQSIEQFEPDLVILDVKMPELNGLELARSLRSKAQWQDIPILFVSAYTDAQTIQHVFSAGGDDYIRKPVVVTELAVRIQKWLKRSNIQQQSERVLQHKQKSSYELNAIS